MIQKPIECLNVLLMPVSKVLFPVIRTGWVLPSRYIAEKIEISLNAADVNNRGGFIVEAIRGNYIDPAVQKERELRAEKAKEKNSKT